ncbi:MULTISPECIES: hypothetical protein [unclassified Sphingomonas]|uniref:hypothetical protein n=1 Tax=Novosphingobium rhizosphaerae TaxID=1551649 RepID=UPI0015C75C80
MRFLLVLFALLSGLSLPEVANATTRTEVAGAAQAGLAVAPVAAHCVVQAARVRAARPAFDVAQHAASAPLAPLVLAHAATLRCDRARE